MSQEAFQFIVTNFDVEEIEDQVSESITKFVTPPKLNIHTDIHIHTGLKN